MLHVEEQRRSPNKMVGGTKSHLESNPIPARDTWRAQTKPCAPGPRHPTEAEPAQPGSECLLQTSLSAVACCRGRGSGCSSCQSSHRTGGTDSWRAQTKPGVHQDLGGRSSDPTGDWPRLACECPGVSGRGVGWQWPAAGLGALSVAVHARDVLKEVASIFLDLGGLYSAWPV